MSRLDHANVICAISDSQQNRLLVLFHELDNEGLLEGRYTTCINEISVMLGFTERNGKLTANDSFTHNGEFKESLRDLFLQSKGQAIAICSDVNHQCGYRTSLGDAPMINARSSSSPEFRWLLIADNRLEINS